MLLTRISIPPPSEPEPEDIFQSALTAIFTDDAVNFHGTPGSSVTYRSPCFGDLSLRIPAHPDAEDGRKLFAHYLWNAAVVAADAIESASTEYENKAESSEETSDSNGVPWAEKHFNVRQKRIFELGAGTGLPSIISALVGASSCTITDHPSSPALTMGAIEQNVRTNLKIPPERPSQAPLSEGLSSLKSRSQTEVQIRGYTWGTSTFQLPSTYGKPAPKATLPEYFDRIIIADCLWMPSQHINIIRTILTFLPPAPPQSSSSANPRTLPKDEAEAEAEANVNHDPPCALVIAGFHTGRKIVSDFFHLATQPAPDPQRLPASNHNPNSSSDSITNSSSPQTPPPPEFAAAAVASINTIPLNTSTLTPSDRSICGQLRLASINEVDVDGKARPWSPERAGESKWETKRWCVVGVLVRR